MVQPQESYACLFSRFTFPSRPAFRRRSHQSTQPVTTPHYAMLRILSTDILKIISRPQQSRGAHTIILAKKIAAERITQGQNHRDDPHKLNLEYTNVTHKPHPIQALLPQPNPPQPTQSRFNQSHPLHPTNTGQLYRKGMELDLRETCSLSHLWGIL